MSVPKGATQEKVGVLLVHGIGEQSQFEHLEGEVRNIAAALKKAAAKTNRNYFIQKLQAIKELPEIEQERVKKTIEKTIDKLKQGKIESAIAKLVQINELIVAPIGLKNAVENLSKIEIKKLSETELSELAAKKVAAKARIVRVTVNAFPSAAFGAKQESWHDGGRSPAIVEVYDYDYQEKKIGRITKFHFHQVWWADLDEPPTLASEIRFWLWGLSLWTIKGKPQSDLPGSTRMKQPENSLRGKKLIFARISLFWVSLVILLILPVLSLLNFFLRQLLGLKIPPPNILSQYIGDVKLFQQETRIGKGSLQDLDSPPRVTLRRRMIQGLVKMALRRYDRWYILAHSQGTVLAFNGIMETAQSLPNYLTQDLWKRAKIKPPHGNPLIREALSSEELLSEEERQTMSPNFPSWRDREFILDRKELFKNCQGLLTYGSPLSKFAALWPAIVPLNQEKYVFRSDFQWLNVYDPSDPVAGETQAFQIHEPAPQATNGYKAARPIDIPYKADSFHLLSHTKYLNPCKGEQPCLVDLVVRWLLSEDSRVEISQTEVMLENLPKDRPDFKIKRGSRRWLKSSSVAVYRIMRIGTWPILAFFIGCFLSILIGVAIPKIPSLQAVASFAAKIISQSQAIIVGGISYIGLAIAIVLIVGIVVMLWKIVTDSNR